MSIGTADERVSAVAKSASASMRKLRITLRLFTEKKHSYI
jgi:hypothetical protein